MSPKQGSLVSYSATTQTVSNDMTFPCARFALVSQLFDFFIGQVLYADEHVLDFADTDQLVELDLNRSAVAVL